MKMVNADYIKKFAIHIPLSMGDVLAVPVGVIDEAPDETSCDAQQMAFWIRRAEPCKGLQCSACGNIVSSATAYCSQCGKKMRIQMSPEEVVSCLRMCAAGGCGHNPGKCPYEDVEENADDILMNGSTNCYSALLSDAVSLIESRGNERGGMSFEDVMLDIAEECDRHTSCKNCRLSDLCESDPYSWTPGFLKTIIAIVHSTQEEKK